jgi:hypothetical protein
MKKGRGKREFILWIIYYNYLGFISLFILNCADSAVEIKMSVTFGRSIAQNFVNILKYNVFLLTSYYFCNYVYLILFAAFPFSMVFSYPQLSLEVFIGDINIQ